MQHDIYIRQVSCLLDNPEKTAVELYKFIKIELENQGLSEKFGPIDYVDVWSKTSLEQEDYVAFLAFDKPKIHKEFVEVFNKPLQFLNRSMLFEVNQKPTNVHQQKLNRNRFMENLKKFNRLKRYFDEQSESTEPKLKKTTLNVLNEKTFDDSSSYDSNTSRSTTEKTAEFIPITVGDDIKSNKYIQENKFLRNRVMELEGKLLAAQLERINETTRLREVVNKSLFSLLNKTVKPYSKPE
ncbi:unnamed protein product [Brachionus calyciflorus]|uniref:Uncharacterized protein n=1 Tax=Brachionus calyciflorus TaxID=104777 RepID=A0A814L5F3_9BILA|nr:unnamed protein product [Brachionus calyciflorus]